MPAVKNKTSKNTYKKPLLVHHRHSFKLLHHRHTNYALQLFILLITAIFCFGWTALAKGDVIHVDAVVQAQPITAPATIVSPLDGAVVRSPQLTVTGSCPASSYINLSRGGTLLGSALCQADGSWRLQVMLIRGDNRLQAQDYNVTNAAGPAGNVVTVHYEPANNRAVTAGPDAPTTPQVTRADAAPLNLSSDVTYRGVYVGELARWQLMINGGAAPYALQIDWGDGQSDLQSVRTDGPLTIAHTYAAPGDYRNSYTITIQATDADGRTTPLQLFVIVSPQATGSGSSGLTPDRGNRGQTGGGIYGRFIAIAGPVYAATFIGVASFWLGEHYQLERLRELGQKHRPRGPRHRAA